MTTSAMSGRAMRVVMLLDTYFPRSHGGVEVYTRDLAAELRRLGHDVRFACPSSEERPDEILPGGVPVHFYPFPAETTKAEYRLTVPPRGFEQFTAWLDEVRPDVLHAHYPSGPASVPHLEYARARGVTTLLTLHFGAATCIRNTGRRHGTPMLRWGRIQCDGTLLPTRCSACLLQAYGLPRPVAWGVAAAERTGVRLVPSLEDRVGARAALPAVVARKRAGLHRLHDALDALVVSTEWQRGALLANGLDPARIAVVRHGTRVTGQARRRTQGEPVVFGWAGRPVPEKGLAELLDAFRGLDAPRATLRVACAATSAQDHSYRAELEARHAEDRRIEWVPPFESDRMSEFYGDIDVFLAPYAMETGPFTVVEAFAHGVPVIGSAVGGIRELVRERVDGRLFAYGSVAALRAALAEAVSLDTRERWAAAVTWSRTFADVASEYVSIYDGTGGGSETPQQPRPSGGLVAL